MASENQSHLPRLEEDRLLENDAKLTAPLDLQLVLQPISATQIPDANTELAARLPPFPPLSIPSGLRIKGIGV